MSDEWSIPHSQPLDGAGIEAGRVARQDSSVLRPGGPWSSSVQSVLAALVDDGVTTVPAPLGIDSGGRERLAYLQGRDQGWPLLHAIQSLEGAYALGALVRELQAALRRYRIPADARWQGRSEPAAPGEIIQHGDLGPWNLLWSDGGESIVGVLDWELAEPEHPTYDLGFLAWHTVPAMDDERASFRGFTGPPDRSARLASFAAGAGVPARDLAAAITRSQLAFARKVDTRGRSSDGGRWRQLRDLGLEETALSDYRWTKQWLASDVDRHGPG